MNTCPGAASNRAMLTVHKLSTNHLILVDNDIAKQARETGIEEVLVVIDRGAIVRVHTPPCEGDEFASDDDWIFAAIRDAYARGADSASVESRLAKAPEGWTLWRDLKPGTIATSGDPGEAEFLAIGERDCFGLARPRDACSFGPHAPRHTFVYKTDAIRPWPFVKVIRTGLTRDQIHSAINSIEAGSPVDLALPEAAQ